MTSVAYSVYTVFPTLMRQVLRDRNLYFCVFFFLKIAERGTKDLARVEYKFLTYFVYFFISVPWKLYANIFCG